MQKKSFSPLRSPNKQKPKITFKLSPSPLRQRKNVANTNFNQNSAVVKNDQTVYRYELEKKQNCPSRIDQIKKVEGSKIRSNSFLTDQNVMFSNHSSKTISQKQFKCEKCSKRKQSYLIVDQNTKYCSNCALEQMKKGKQVRSLNELQPLRSVSPDCSKVKNKCIDLKKSKQVEITQLLTRIDNEQKKVRHKIENQLQESIIRENFNSRRQKLKRHYQRLKEIIQISIKKDLQNLKKSEQLQIQQLKNKKQAFIKDLNSLQNIRTNLKQTQLSRNEEWTNELVKNDVSSQDFAGGYFYTGKINKNSIETAQIQKRLQFQQNLSKKNRFISNKQYLYEPEVFMLSVEGILGNSLIQPSQYSSNTLFSFQGI